MSSQAPFAWMANFVRAFVYGIDLLTRAIEP